MDERNAQAIITKAKTWPDFDKYELEVVDYIKCYVPYDVFPTLEQLWDAYEAIYASNDDGSLENIDYSEPSYAKC